ncbi:MAG: gamma-glutamyltransferase family protein [Rhodanobacteraceae bacterium]|jgi:gamma-glutamyltranspeptidase/glutathione hydrolase|nr:MAG: gamma-glutamyltransferase family protein [Rhodanobacteraceae bacterium]
MRKFLLAAVITLLAAGGSASCAFADQSAPASASSAQSAQDGPIQARVESNAERAWPDEPLVAARHGMVVSAQHLATQIGVDILKQGGNAVDAAVAVGYALAVVHPCCGNIGGGGFMTLHLADGRNLFLDFREKAPLAATPDMMQNAEGKVVKGRSTRTWLGVGVPGTVMGFDEALQLYGTMRLQQVIAPAIKLAKDGYVLDPGDVRILDTSTDAFRRNPNVAAIFLDHGQPWKAGQVLKQPQLAHTLEMISEGGTKAFYEGPIAAAVVKASEASGGLLTMKDFSDYTVQWERPIECGYHGYTIISSPPPSSGGTTICETLQIIAPYPFAEWGFHSARSAHYFVEAERRAFADRNTYLGDPAFVHNPITKLLSAEHAAELRAGIQPDKATPSSEVQGSLGPYQGTNTTHYSVVDGKGNAVAVTYTVNSYFGIKQIAGDTGFFLNNEMDDFTSKPDVPNQFGLVQGEANRIQPGKRPLSSMSPTIVLRDGKLFMVTGSPGGSTIISTTMESFLNVAEYGMNVKQAIDAPRIHMQWYPDQIFAEPGAFAPDVQTALEAMGYTIRTIRSMGDIAAIVVNPKTGMLESVNDPRYPAGSAAGY